MKVKKGNYGYKIPAKVLKADFTAFDLTGYTVKMKVWIKGAETTKWILDGSITDATKGKVEFTVENTHFIEVGNFLGELELTSAGSVESTKSFAIEVEESL